MQSKLFSFSKNNHVYVLFLLLLLIDRVILLTNFNFKYVGSDDLIFWQAATDYMHGKFYEPYFYGQNYNFMLESFFAIPFIKIGIPYFYAFPICSSIIALFPFIFTSFVLKKNGYFIESLCFLILPVLLPIEYGILTSVTRGFISGLFFNSFLIISLLSPSKKTSWFIAAFSISIGFIFNPNSLVFSFPICLYMFLINWNKFTFYIINILIIIPVLSIQYFAKKFYENNQEFNVNGMQKITFKVEKIFDNFQHLDQFFNYFTPILWFSGWLIIFIIFFLSIYIINKDLKKGLSLLFGVIFIIFTLGINKVNDHIDSIFLSSTRMFLGIPLFTGLAFFWIREYVVFTDRQIKLIFVNVAFTVFFVKASILPTVTKFHTTITNYGSVAIKKSKELVCDCNKLNSIADKYNATLFAFVPAWNINVPHMEFYNYGCPLLIKKFPNTVMNIYEKRTWVYLKEKTKIEKNILIYGSDIITKTNEIKQNKNLKDIDIEVISKNPTIIIIKNNKIRLDSLFKKLMIDFKRNAYS